MSKKSIGFKVRLGFDDAESIRNLLNIVRLKLEHGDINPDCKLTGIEITDNKDYSYSVMFNFDDEISVDDIMDKAITGE